MKKILLFVGLIFSLNLLAVDEAEVTQTDINEQNSLSDASMKDITPKSVDEFFDEFEQEHGISFEETKNNKTFYKGIASTILSPSDPEFVKALTNAYEKAILDLQYNYIRDTFGKQITEKMQSSSRDNSSDAREFPELAKGSKFSQFLDKLVEFAGAKIDAELKEMGISVEGLTQEQKKTLFQNEFIKRTITRAFGNMSGLVPVQSIITKNKEGTYDIGVIAVMSNKTMQIARDVSKKRKSVIKGNGKPVKEFLPKDEKGFLNEYGIRMVYDETGAPIIISYGHWGYVPASSDAAINREVKRANQETALELADAAISEFVNINISLFNEQVTGENLEQVIKRETTTSGSNDSEQVIKNIIDTSIKNIKTTSKIDIRGIRTIKKWDAKDENGLEHVGVVRVYSYANVENTNKMLKQQDTSKSKDKTIQRKSKQVNSIDDF